MRIYYLAGGDVDNPRYQRAFDINARYDANILRSRYGAQLRAAEASGLGRRDALAYQRIANQLNSQQIPRSVYMGLNNG